MVGAPVRLKNKDVFDKHVHSTDSSKIVLDFIPITRTLDDESQNRLLTGFAPGIDKLPQVAVPLRGCIEDLSDGVCVDHSLEQCTIDRSD